MTTGNFPWHAIALSALGGVLMFLGWAGFGVWPLELVALVPFWAALELVAGRTWKTAFLVGGVYGIVAMGGGYHWMLEAAHVFSGLGMPATVGFFVLCSVYLGLQYALQGALYSGVRARGWSLPVAALSTFLAAEWLFPKWFPVYFGNALVQHPVLTQTADLGGPLLLSGFVGVVNVSVLEVFRWRRGMTERPVVTLAVSATFVAFALVYGIVRIRQLDERAKAAPALDVGLVQANLSLSERAADPLESTRRHLEQSRDLEARERVDLLVWPELAYHSRFGRSVPFRANPLRGEVATALLFGAYSFDDELARRRLYNTAFLMHEDGTVRELYDKTHLLVGGEYLPFGESFPFLYELSPNTGRLTATPEVAPLSLGPWRISTPICYEDILPRYVRRMVNEADPHILINLTDDVWLGTGQAPWIHFRLAQLRAVEHRRYLLRATNSGVSAIVDPVGRVVAHTDVGTRENLHGTVHMLEGRTLYARLGDWPGWLSVLAVGVMLVSRGAAKR